MVSTAAAASQGSENIEMAKGVTAVLLNEPQQPSLPVKSLSAAR